ncbi:creatininase family protein [Chitinophaga japonensis]|uniref:Creatinine amidohydrolase/Fe(II)-dependent formamide hydrolase-like protein n=1 Tax=Chitinophaga japonensis TaxID=104662 RepID=A0A562T050_CHIJA|nr:creatininase family protein [Chitinophaga japonensis]TWI86733.1 creatinine amidohydrolase/Fe(II)-dependent formamide hydrolase-like protein [Chitinophaga japonensis]
MSRYLFIITFLCCGLRGLAQQAPPTVFLEEMTSQELQARIRAGAETVLVFSGGTEASGPHLALGKHNYRVRQYAAQLADSLGALVAPVLPFAPNSPVLQRFPGTITLSDETFYAVNEEVARSLAAAGFRHIVLLSDHYNSQQPLQRLAARLDSALQGSGVRVLFCSDGYARARKQIESRLAAEKQVPGGHGGLWDTAETMAAAPDAVRPALFAAGDTTHGGNGPLNAAGVSGDPRAATAALGREFGALRVQLALAEIRAWQAQAARQQAFKPGNR